MHIRTYACTPYNHTCTACLEGYDVGSEGAYACLVGCSASSLATNPDDTTTILRSEDYLSYANMDLSGSLYLILVPSSDDSGFVNLLGTDVRE